MRRYLSIIISFLIILAVLIALSAAGSIEFDRPEESELNPIRSSYSTGPTGTRAFYQLLEESGKPVARWRESYHSLGEKAGDALLICVGPFKSGKPLLADEALSLQKWIATGGNALIISRHPLAQFGDPLIHSEIPTYIPPRNQAPEMLVNNKSDELIAQPTELTKDLRGLALSRLAARITFKLPEKEISQADEVKEGRALETTTPTPSPEPEAEEEFDMLLYAPLVHIGDKDGAILADFKYGKGRLIFLSDPFVIANNGIAQGSNLTLALNLINTLSADEKNSARRIFFDEFHHGYHNENNPLVTYFRGTPMPWLIVQGLLLSLLTIYSYGKRFARPLPLPQVDRHSPLEFVSSMANLQQVAQARDLAIENIYPRFKAQLCRRLGLSSRAGAEEIIANLRRQRLPISEIELRQALSEGDLVLKGEQLDDAQLVRLVARMRQIMGQLKS